MATILVIDDSISVRKALERALTAEGHTMRTAASGEEGLSRLVEETPELVLCDLVLPDIDGFEIGRFMRRTAALSQVPLVFISAHVTEEKLAEAQTIGAHGILKKPFAAEELSRIVAELVPVQSLALAPPSEDVFGEPPEPRLQGPALPPIFATAIEELQTLPGLMSAILIQDSAYHILASRDGDENPVSGLLDATLTGVLAAAGNLQLGRVKNIVLELEARTLVLSELKENLCLLVMLDSALGVGRARYCAQGIARSFASEASEVM